jgi:hypothetical protein
MAAAVGRRGLGCRAQLLLAWRARALRDGLAVFLCGAAGAALGASLAGHYLVSRWGVCLPHQRQYFLNSMRSGVFRFDFSVW